jgi:hypothetical protein
MGLLGVKLKSPCLVLQIFADDTQLALLHDQVPLYC